MASRIKNFSKANSEKNWNKIRKGRSQKSSKTAVTSLGYAYESQGMVHEIQY